MKKEEKMKQRKAREQLRQEENSQKRRPAQPKMFWTEELSEN